MTLKINGEQGSVSIDAPADTSPSGSDITLTLPTTVGSANQFVKNGGTAGELEYSSMVEDSSSNIGIGITSPTKKLHIDSSSDQIRISDGSGGFEFRGGNVFKISDDGSERLRIDGDGHTHLGPRTGNNNATSFSDAIVNICGPDDIATNFSKAACYLHLGNNESTTNGIYPLGFGFTSADRTHIPAYIAYMTEDSAGAEHGPLIFATRDVTTDTAPIQRMKITSNGSFRASTNTSLGSIYGSGEPIHAFENHDGNNVCLYLQHTSDSTPYGMFIHFNRAAPDNNSEYFITGQDSSAVRIRIWSDGDIDNHDNSYGSLSDVKLKQDIVDSGSQWEDLKNLRVRKFKFKSDVAAYGDEAKTLIGLVAQEAETVSPGLVKDNPDQDEHGNDLGTTTKAVRYSVLYMKAIKALQEAQTRIETLETQNTAQQAQIDDLLTRVTALEAAE